MISSGDRQRLAENWQAVCDEVATAVTSAGRSPSSVCIVGVSKYVGPELTAALAQVGCRNLGESRPQLLWSKAEALKQLLPDHDIRWHLIGHLQRNKIRRTMSLPVLVHSVDAARLLAAIDQDAASQDQSLVHDVLLEVNVSGETAKTGMTPSEIRELLAQPRAEHVRIIGLMAMAGWGTSSAEARQQFATVRELRDSLQTEFAIELPQLSMGMSGDFVEAIAEGATLVRIGSRLFDGLLIS